MNAARNLTRLAALSLFAVQLTAPAMAGEDPAARIVDPAAALGIAESSSAQLTALGLVWDDYRLMRICAELGGTFAKLNASSLYRCQLPETPDRPAHAASL